MCLNKKLSERLAEFEELESTEEKFEVLIEYSEKFKPLKQELKTNEHLIEGCTSNVFIKANNIDGKIFLEGDADSLIIKGVLQIIFESINGSTPEEVMELKPEILETIGLSESTTQSRANLSYNLIKKIKEEVKKIK